MSPRPQKVSDLEVFAAVNRAMQRLGPADLTLAEIAAEAGVTAGALVQRFGSKRELLLALQNAFGEGGREMMAALRAEHGTPVATIRAYAACMGELAKTPDALARNLAYLQIDLTDADFRKPLQRNARATRAELESLIREGIASGEIARGTNAPSLARTLETVISGALLTWAVHREGQVASWMTREVDAVLAPYVNRKARSTRGSRR